MDILQLSPPPADARLPYGSDALQFGDLRLPKTEGRHPLVIVIHGGFWRAAYGLDHIGHLCAALTAAGLATWNLEYRRIGNNGGGWPGTFEDVLRGADYVTALAAKYPVDAQKTIAVGHSAGGHLALLLAARQRVCDVVSLAGVADLRCAWELGLSNNVVMSFLGGSPEEVPDRYRQASPLKLLPLGVPQRLVHGAKDDVVPLEISEDYVKAANAAGDDARLVVLPEAGHFELIDPRSAEWPHIQQTILSLL
jgi:acetyl esterase/lipase